MEALEAVSQGGYFFESPMSPEAVERLKSLSVIGPRDAVSRYESLTSRQQEVLRLLVQGVPYKSIAEQLHITPRTVANHRAQIMDKLGVTNSAELVRLAERLGW